MAIRSQVVIASAGPPAWVDRLRAQRWYGWPWHYLLLAAWAACWFWRYAKDGGQSWHLFTAAARLAAGGHPAGYGSAGGLHLYASYPKFQFGPPTLLVTAVLRLIGPDQGVVAAQLVMTGCGLVILAVAERSARLARPDVDPERIRWTLLGAGVVFWPAWQILAVSFTHLDDVLALLFAVLAVRALVAGNAALTGVLLALSGGSKPWAYAFLALLLALPASGVPWSSPRWRALAWAAGVTVLLWVPFVIADPGTLSAARYAIPNVEGSGLRALGITSPKTPSWDRPAQILVGLGLSALAVARGRWPAVLLIGVAVRVGLDPNTYPYYDAGLVTGALVWDLTGPRQPVPAWTLAAAAMFWGWDAAGPGTIAGWTRVAFALIAAAYTTLAPAALPVPDVPMAPADPP
jgi:hypothetical protein